MGFLRIYLLVGSFLLFQGTSAVDPDRVSVKEGDSVTLKTGVETNQKDTIKWYYNDTRIAQNNGDQSKICTDVQCKARFRDRLKLDHQTGSLTIMNTRTTDSGLYELKITRDGRDTEKNFSVSVHDVESVSVMEGDPVTLNTGVETNQQHRISWHYNDTRIAEISRDPGKICTDVQCNEANERFRDRLKLDHQTGSLTIMNIRTEYGGVYKLLITGGGSDQEKIFSVSVHGVSAAERDEVKIKSVKEGESVTLDPGVTKNQNDLMTWHFSDTLIAEINGDPSKICTDVQCNNNTERFRGRLKLDHQTGSLTIMNIRTTDSGVYELKISSSSSRRRRSISFSTSREKSFSVSVTGSGPSPGVVAGIVAGVVGVLLVSVAAALGVICYRPMISRKNAAFLTDGGKTSGHVI